MAFIFIINGIYCYLNASIVDFSKAETVTGKCVLSALAKHGYFFPDQAGYREPFKCPAEGQMMFNFGTHNEVLGKALSDIKEWYNLYDCL